MAANIHELIAKLKREIPELAHNPLLDEIETAAYEQSPEDQASVGEADEGSPDEEAQDQTEMEGEGSSSEQPAPPVSAMYKKKMPPRK